MKNISSNKSRVYKTLKFTYYMGNFWRLATPKLLCRIRLKAILKKAEQRADSSYIKDRVDYYNQLSTPCTLPQNSTTLRAHKFPKRLTSYFFDTYQYTRFFDQSYRWGYCPGDIVHVPRFPSVVKSRPIVDDNQNSIIMKLDKARHFVFVKDRIEFADKKDMLIFRGDIGGKPARCKFMDMYFGHPMCDLGNVGIHQENHPEWIRPKKRFKDHLYYKFILALEGNDVASNLKWVMSSRSVAVMPKPTCETWFMEGRLIADYHYIEIKPDFSDLEERLNYYIAHPEKAEQISVNANRYVAQFRNKKREKIISLLVLDKYFQLTNQS